MLRCTVQLQGALLIKAPEFAPPSNTSRHPRGTSLRCLPVRTRRGEVSSLCFPYNKVWGDFAACFFGSANLMTKAWVIPFFFGRYI